MSYNMYNRSLMWIYIEYLHLSRCQNTGINEIIMIAKHDKACDVYRVNFSTAISYKSSYIWVQQ